MSPGTARGTQTEPIRFCTGAAGDRIAWSRRGTGPAIVIVAPWFGHTEPLDDLVRTPFLDALAEHATVVRFDERGTGHSECSAVTSQLTAWITDVGAVADAAGLDEFVLLGVGSPGGCGSAVAIAYAAQHPERVRALVVYGGGAAPPADADLRGFHDALIPLMPAASAREDRAVQRLFTSLTIPDSSEAEKRDLDELLFRIADGMGIETGAVIARAETDVRPLLAGVRVPTLVLHSTRDRLVPFADAQRIARGIPGARLVPLGSDNHFLLPHEAAWRTVIHEITALVAAEPSTPSPAASTRALDGLSPRELDVLHLVASGADNEEIADKLFLSVRTVERHLHNTYVKLGVSGKSARAAAVARLLQSG